MRKSLLVFFTSFAVLLFVPFFVYAKDSTPPGELKRVDAKLGIGQKQLAKENIKAEIQRRVEDRKASQEAKVANKKRERIRNHWEMLEKRISATIERLNRLVTRIESRLAKISQDNPEMDFSPIQTNVNEAKVLLDNANVMLEEASFELDSLLEAENPKIAFESLRTTIGDIKDTLTEAHRILVHVIGNIRGLRVGKNSVNPTSVITPIIVLSPTTEVSPTTIDTTPTPIPEEGV